MARSVFVPMPWATAATPLEFSRAKKNGKRVVVPESRNISAWFYKGKIYLEGKR